MTTALKTGLMAAAIALTLPVGLAHAALATHISYSNSVNHCQAFTPGAANTIRNRVVGVENVGSAPVAVGCNWHSMNNGAPDAADPRTVTLWFANNNASGTITVTCTLLTGRQGEGGTGQYAVTKTTPTIAAGGVDQYFLSWTQADNPVAGATTLGNKLIGVNCTLPPGGVINDTYMLWNMDNGV